MKSRGTWLDLAGDTRIMVLLLAGGVVAFVVVFVILISNASFTESSQSTGNRLDAGKTGLSLSKPGPIVDATNLAPGDTRTGDIEVTNTGASGTLSVTPKGAASAPALASALRLKITPRAEPGNALYSGAFADAGRIVLGRYATGGTGAWAFEIKLPANIDRALGGTSLDASFEWETRTG